MAVFIREPGVNINDLASGLDVRKDLDRITPQTAHGHLLSNSICGIVPTKYLTINADNTCSFKISAQGGASSLRKSIIEQGMVDCDIKKRMLKSLIKDQAKTQQRKIDDKIIDDFLEKLPWPFAQGKTPNVDIQFLDQQVPSYATGFYIGHGRIATAGHVSYELFLNSTSEDKDQLNIPTLSDFRVVFGMAGTFDQRTFRCFEIDRIVHNSWTVLPASAKKIIYPEYQENPVDLQASGEFFDFSVLQLQMQDIAAPLDALDLSQQYPVENTPVFTIGTAQGLPFKYVGRDQLLAPDPKILRGDSKLLRESESLNAWATMSAAQKADLPPTARQGTFTADLETWKGNSGGPVFSGVDNAVIGLVRSGVSDWAAITGMGVDGTKSPLKAAIDKGFRKFGLKRIINQGAKEVPVDLEIDPRWTDSVAGLKLFSNRTTTLDKNVWTWPYLPANSLPVRNFKRFTRIDPILFLNRSLASFLPVGPAAQPIVGGPGGPAPIQHPGGTVDVKIIISFDASKEKQTDPLKSPLLLKINTFSKQALVSEQAAGANGQLNAGSKLEYVLKRQGDPFNPLPPKVSIPLSLDPNLWTLAGGLHDFDNLVVTRTAGARVPTEIRPVAGNITATFTVNPRPGVAGYPARVYTFEVGLDFNKFDDSDSDSNDPGKQDSWVAFIAAGNKDDIQHIWSGPK